MSAIVSSFARALAQLADPNVLRILLKSLGMTLVGFVIVAVVGWYSFDAQLAWLGLGDTAFTGAGTLREVASLLIAILFLWFLWRVIAMAVIQFYAEDVVHAVEARHYPAAASAARELARTEQVKAALGGTARALLANAIALPFALALLFTGVGTALLFWAVNGWLIGRELQDMVWLRHAHQREGLCPVSKFERFLLGSAVAALLMVPFINFLAPVLGAAGATHLVHRKIRG